MRLAFLTATRADYGKLRPLIAVARDTHDAHVIVTGMHLSDRHGMTAIEVERFMSRTPNRCWRIPSGIDGDLARVASKTLDLVSHTLAVIKPDALVVHGDRTEALAGALAATLAGIRVIHVEGGEVSGSVDDKLRYAITQLADVHLVANDDAAEAVAARASDDDVHVIGSPEVDTLLGPLPSFTAAIDRYDVPFEPADYGIAIYHPVVHDNEPHGMGAALARALVESDRNWIVLTPNADPGEIEIRAWVDALSESDHFRVVPSMRFELFATLLRDAALIIGNSSCGVREAPVLGTPTINVGVRQSGRSSNGLIRHIDTADAGLMLATITELWGRRFDPVLEFGDGHAAERFLGVLGGMG